MCTVELEYKFNHKSFGEKVVKISEDDTERTTLYNNRKKVDNLKKTATIEVSSESKGTKIKVTGSIAKFFYAHNIYGPNNIKKAAILLINRVLKQLGLTPSKEELDRLDAGQIKICRIDLVGNILCDSESHKKEVLKVIKDYLFKTQDIFSNYYGETLYCKQNSKSKAIKLYDKLAQVMACPSVKKQLLSTLKGLDTYEECMEHIRKLIRIEVCFRNRYLKSKGLQYVKDWDEDTFKSLLFESISELKLSGEYSMPTIDIISKIKNISYRQTYYSYLKGLPLKEIITNRKTYYNHLNYFKSTFNIDLELPADTYLDLKSIESLVTQKNIIISRPKIFIPPKK